MVLVYHSTWVSRHDAPVAESSYLTITDSISYTDCSLNQLQNPPSFAHLCQQHLYWPLPPNRPPIRHVWIVRRLCQGLLLLPLTVGNSTWLNNATPSLHHHYSVFIATRQLLLHCSTSCILAVVRVAPPLWLTSVLAKPLDIAASLPLAFSQQVPTFHTRAWIKLMQPLRRTPFSP